MNTPVLSRWRSLRGFTLVELLTVIAIVGILAAIIIPVSGSVRKKAQAATCVSNLRQIGVAMQLYAGANKGNLPAPQDEDNINGATPHEWWTMFWMYQIQPYLESRLARDDRMMLNYGGIFRCPGKEEWDLSGANDGYRISYAMNVFDSNAMARKVRRNIRNFTNPGLTMLVMDHAARSPEGAIVSVVGYLQSNRQVYRDRIDLRHDNRSHVLFVDGHVEALPQWGLNYYLMKEPGAGPNSNDQLRPW